MKLVCIPYCSNPDSGDAELLLLEITPEMARKFLADARKCAAFLKEVGIDAEADYFGGCVSLGTDLEFRIFGGGILETLSIESGLGDTEWLNIDDAEAKAVFGPSAEEVPIHVACMEVLAGRVYLSASGTLTGDRYESKGLTFEQLSAIGAGKDLSEARRTRATPRLTGRRA